MNESIIAVRYAKALHQLGNEKKCVEQIYSDMGIVLQSLHEVPSFATLLESPVLKPSKKIEIFNTCFPSFHSITHAFFKNVVANRREMYLADIARKYITSINKEKNIVVAKITTMTKISDEAKQKLSLLVSKNIKSSEIQWIEEIDEKIIGGFILNIDDNQIDASISTRLSKIKQKLLKTPVK